MRVTGIRELKNRLSEYLRAVRAGETVLVTDRGRVIAELRPPGQPGYDLESPALATLVREGLVRPAVANRPELYPVLPRRAREGTALALLNETRGDR